MTDNYITRGWLQKPAENIEDGKLRCTCNGCSKMDVYDWLEDIPDDGRAGDLTEVRFKNTRKGYYINTSGHTLLKGDIVAVEAAPGHDIGVVSLTGELVNAQMKRYKISDVGLKKIYRKAKPGDIEKWFQVIEKEPEATCIARQIVSDLKLDMKISDVEFQGDKTKAIFYYISDERIDFRQLIKEYADHFKIRIEMKQIGARQEAGKVGGIGTCGRELCCASWMSSFISVSTSAARYQDMSLNPQKLAGQCGKLKCCLNYELKTYIDAQNDFPETSMPLETEQGKAYRQKIDVLRRIVWYSFEKDNEEAKHIPVDVDVVREIILLNQKGIKVKELKPSSTKTPLLEPSINYQNSVGEDNISRFEEKKKKKKKKNTKAGKENKEHQAPKNSENLPRKGTQTRQDAFPRKEPKPKPAAADNKPKTEQPERNPNRNRNKNQNRKNREKSNPAEGSKSAPNPPKE